MCISVQDICGVYFYAPVGGANGTYVGQLILYVMVSRGGDFWIMRWSFQRSK